MSIIENINQRAKLAVRGWLGLEQGMSMSAGETTTQKLISTYRNYYAGVHKVFLTDRQKAWLDQHDGNISFTVNHTATVVDAVVERLRVLSFASGDPALDATLWQWWQDNRMDVVQVETHRTAVRDGESAVITTWNEDERRPEYILHPRFVEKSAGGDGFGFFVDYPNDNYLTRPNYAVKRWTDADNKERHTYYYPDRIERYITQRGKLVEYSDNEGDQWPIPWVNQAGRPIGIPVAHFRNSGLESDIKPIIPLQDALNKAWLDLMAASDMTAFRMLVFLGWVPTTDGKEPDAEGSNLVKVAPGQMLATRKAPDTANVHEIEPADLTPLLEVEDRIVYRMALLSNIPASRFLTSKQIAGAETQKEQEKPLIAKVEERQALFGNGWEDLCAVSLRMAQAFGGMSIPDKLQLSTVWKPAGVVDEEVQLANARSKQGLGVPFEMVMANLGYTADEIKTMMNSPEYRARLALLSMDGGG